MYLFSTDRFFLFQRGQTIRLPALPQPIVDVVHGSLSPSSSGSLLLILRKISFAQTARHPVKSSLCAVAPRFSLERQERTGSSPRIFPRTRHPPELEWQTIPFFTQLLTQLAPMWPSSRASTRRISPPSRLHGLQTSCPAQTEEVPIIPME